MFACRLRGTLQTDRQTDRQTGRQTDRQTDGQQQTNDRQTNKQTDSRPQTPLPRATTPCLQEHIASTAQEHEAIMARCMITVSVTATICNGPAFTIHTDKVRRATWLALCSPFQKLIPKCVGDTSSRANTNRR